MSRPSSTTPPKVDWVELLRGHPILSSLDEKHAGWLVSEQASTERSYGPGAVILREGELGDSIFLIGAGSAEAVLLAEGGQPILLSLMLRGETFGEMGFFEGLPRSATVRARETCVVLEIRGQELRQLAEARPDIEFKVLLKASERLRSKNEQILALHLKGVEDANRAKDDFLALLGHELRNPLGAINNAVHVLDRLGDPDEKAAQLRGIIARQTQHLSQLVGDLLNVSQVVSGRLVLHKQLLDLRDQAVRALSSLQESGKTTQHVIALTGEPVIVSGDPTRLEQILSNLLDNAVKYTPPGGRIEVTIAAEGTEAVVRVRDTGIGIQQAMLPLIFDLFVQASQNPNRPKGSLGVGLTLVRRLVELHGGAVSASSDGLNQGSEFVVRLPRIGDAAITPQPSKDEPVPSRARHILIIEDNQDFRVGLRMLVESWGHRVEEAAEGGVGLQIFHASRPEIVLVDLGLPDLDGYEVARAVRSAPGGDALLVAITGYGQLTDRRRAKEAGFDAHLTKPVDPDELARILLYVKDAHRAAGTGPVP
jgi:signal transduction histidine kinase/CheY-like chemotaxis protein